MMTKSSALSLFLALASTSPQGGNAFSPSSIFSRTENSAVGVVAYPSSSALFATKKKIFIDGEAGTTGLQVRDRLAGRDDLEIISIADDKRKDVNERKRLINEADCVILCEWLWLIDDETRVIVVLFVVNYHHSTYLCMSLIHWRVLFHQQK